MNTLKTAGILFALFTLLLGVVYPLAMTGIAQVVFPHKANGSLLIRHGKIVGSELIGQRFTRDKYFHGRPSAVSYDGAGSGASNYGPTEPTLQAQIAQRITAIRASDSLAQDQPIPADIVTASASGLDPHLGVDAALLQVPRIAKARQMDEAAIRALISTHTETPLLSAPHVNVLQLNLALDNLKPL